MTSARTVVPPPSAASLPCRLDVPDALRGEIRYATEELLRPLGLEPAWDAEKSGAKGLWYGISGHTPPDGWIAVEMSPATADTLLSDRPLGAGSVRWTTVGGRRIPVLFEGTLDGGLDPVATAFWWLAGARELRVRARDRHGRFPSAHTLSCELGIEATAPVDDIREVLATALEAAGVVLHRRRWHGRPWVLCPTHDVDYVRKWRKGIIWREVVTNALLNRREDPPGRRARRFMQAAGSMLTPGDPYRKTLDRIPAELSRAGGAATWFFKAGAHGPNDVGYRLAPLRARLARLRDGGHEIGLHPSYHAFGHPRWLERERDRLTRYAGAVPVAVRSHYLRWDVRDSPRWYEAAGFGLDSTVGFADRIGFRHGTCMPFRLWDPVDRRPTDLWEMPLALMESALFNRMGLESEAADARTRDIEETVRRHGGVFVGLWHTTLWDEVDFPGWGRHFTSTLERASRSGAAVLPLCTALKAWAPS